MLPADPQLVGADLRHICFIMDGNGRWAAERGKKRSAGHKEGVARIDPIVERCFFHYQIPAVSLFVFSTENWSREPAEIGYLFRLLKSFFARAIKKFQEKGVRILVAGDLQDPRIPDDVRQVIEKAQRQTAANSRYFFNVLFNYGGRRELVHAAQAIARAVRDGIIDIDRIDEQQIAANLYSPELPPVDLLVRTSGEKRLSNSMIYEMAYAELIFNPVYWPAYRPEDLDADIGEFFSRHRRFGGLNNE